MLGGATERARLTGRLPLLRKRAHLNRFVRSFFDERGFLEIEAPILVPSPGTEVHLDAYTTDNGGIAQRYLITSPEYQMKRLIAGGLERAYSLGKVFRRGERGPHHNPEFTMLEWYATGWSWSELADSVASLVASAAEALHGAPALQLTVRKIDLATPWPRRSVRELFREYAGVELDGDEDVNALRDKLSAFRLPSQCPEGLFYDDLFFSVFLDVVEPALQALSRPCIVYDWPRPMGALARTSPADPRVVERFEAYIPSDSGLLELCNGFGELVDPIEQRSRCEADRRVRARKGLPDHPLDEKFLAALGDMPATSGVALGMDRLAMLLLGARDISDVLPFAVEEL